MVDGFLLLLLLLLLLIVIYNVCALKSCYDLPKAHNDHHPDTSPVQIIDRIDHPCLTAELLSRKLVGRDLVLCPREDKGWFGWLSILALTRARESEFYRRPSEFCPEL
jgi:glycosyltransferase A (GT-A) superfamily protein (DUF2064 family)